MLDKQVVKNYQDEAQSLSEQSNRLSYNITSKSEQLIQYTKIVGDINIIRDLNQQKILKSPRKVRWAEQFSECIKFETLEFGIESIVVMAHYGNYQMEISTLLTSFDCEQINEECFAQGGFGCIYKLVLNGTQFALKGINIIIEEGKINMDHVYREYFMCSIASCLQVGPKIDKFMGYDIVTFKDRALFAMQMCETIQDQANSFDIFNKMVENLRAIHSIGFMHLDIKPDNVVYSSTIKNYVFLDFGFSKIIKEQLGMKTFSFFSGTIGFCSQQMRKSYWVGRQAYIDLYFNDLVCLKNTNVAFSQRKQRQSIFCEYELYNLQRKNHSQHSQLSYFAAAIKICKFKHLIFTRNTSAILGFVEANYDLSMSFYAILSDLSIRSHIREEQMIKALLEKLKKKLIKYSLNICTYDDRISKLFLQKPVCTPHILTLQYLLELPKDKFKRGLKETDFVYRLFLGFDPLSSMFDGHQSANMQKEISNLRSKIVNKITEALQFKESGEIMFFQKLRMTVVFFYAQLKALKSSSVIFSIRCIFLMMQSYYLLEELQQQICDLASGHDRTLAALQFTLFHARVNYIRIDKLSLFKSYTSKNQHEDINKEQKSQILGFAIQLLSIENYLEVSVQFRQECLLIFKEWRKKYSEERVSRIQTVFRSLTNLKINPKGGKTLLQSIYQNKPFHEMDYGHRQTMQYFNLQLKIYYRSKEVSYPLFQMEFEKRFKILKQMNKIQANFLTPKDNAFFYSDYKLAMTIVRSYTSHINSFIFLTDQQCFESFEVVEWMINIFAGNQKYRREYQNQNSEQQRNMISLIALCYEQVKIKTGKLKNYEWYRIVSISLDILFAVFKQDVKPSKAIEQMIQSLIGIISKTCFKVQIMKICMNFIFFTLRKLSESEGGIPQKFYDQLYQILMLTQKMHSQNSLFEFYEKTALLYLIVNISIKRGEWQQSFALIKWVIVKTNDPEAEVNKASIFNIVKLCINAICKSVGFNNCIKLLNQQSLDPVSPLLPEQVYLEHFLLYWIVKQIDGRSLVSYDSLEKSQILLPSLKRSLVRIGTGIRKRWSVFSKEVDIGIYQICRLNLRYVSQRKKSICLRREGQYKRLGMRLDKKVISPIIGTIKQKIKELNSNQQFIIATQDFCFQYSNIGF